MKNNNYTDGYLSDIAKISGLIDRSVIEKMIEVLCETRKRNGRLFIIGVGGGAGNASHAVNDFRKIGGMEAYAPTDNISEITARVNDDGWDTVFASWLKGSRLNANDCILVFSVGGGSTEKNISNNLVEALKYAKDCDANVIGIVGKDGGYTARVADVCLVIPAINETVTPYVESFQSVIWHLIVSHPLIKVQDMKWESVK